LKALIVHNPRAGNGRGEHLARAAQARLQASGWAVQGMPSRSPAERRAGAPPAFAAMIRDADVVVVVGGDGTLREVLMDLRPLGPLPPLALIPAGNANVLAREFGIPDDVDGAMDLVREGRSIAVDCGLANNELFVAMAGVGYDAIAVRWLHYLRETRLGGLLYRAPGGADLLYVLVGIAALFRFAPTRLTAAMDEAQTSRGLATVAVLNTAQYAKHWSLAPDACAHDGWLNTRLEAGALFLRPTLALIAAMRRRHAPSFVARYGRAREIRIEAPRRFAWHLDGDPMAPAMHLDIRLLPAFFDLFVPARYA